MRSHHLTRLPTMRDVAVRAGVSTATVSRAMSHPEKVSWSLQQRIKHAAIEVGYTFTKQLPTRRGEKSDTVLVLVPDISDHFFSEIIHGIETTAVLHNYFVLIMDYAAQQQKTNYLKRLITSHRFDGIIALSSLQDFYFKGEEIALLPPLVLASEFSFDHRLPAIHIDNMTATYNAISHLIKLGHTRIACITGDEKQCASHYRLQGYFQALRRHSLTIDARYIYRGVYTFADGALATDYLLSLPEPPQAIFCHSDIQAVGAVHQAKQLGLKLPNDLSIIGFNDLECARYCDPPLTTVSQPRLKMGQSAMQLLLTLMNGEQVTAESILLPADLVIRESTSRPYVRSKK